MAKIKLKCTNCEKDIERWQCQIPKSGKAYCSASCSTSYRNKYEYNPSRNRDLSGKNNPMYGNGHLITGEKNGMYGRKGKLNPAYVGGVYKRKDGYIRLHTDDGRILEHRKIMMDAGFDIEGKVVHHKNGNTSDNRLSNLQAMTQSEHSKLHHLGKLNT